MNIPVDDAKECRREIPGIDLLLPSIWKISSLSRCDILGVPVEN